MLHMPSGDFVMATDRALPPGGHTSFRKFCSATAISPRAAVLLLIPATTATCPVGTKPVSYTNKQPTRGHMLVSPVG